MKVIIEFEPYEELTSEDWNRIYEFIGQYGGEIRDRSEEDLK